MEDLRFQEIENRTQAWGFGIQQDFLTLLKTIGRHSISIDEFMEYVETRKNNSQKVEKLRALNMEWIIEWEEKAEPCPLCGVLLYLEEPGKNDRGYQSMWRCYTGLERKKNCKDCKDDDTDYSNACGYELFMTETREEVAKQMGMDMTKYQELSW